MRKFKERGVVKRGSKTVQVKKKNDGLFVIDTYSMWVNAILIFLCFFFLLGVRLQINHASTGDEPYYMLMDYSLIHDHDLALTNNYENGDYKSFYDGVLTPQGVPRVEQKYIDMGYSAHQPGLAYLTLPGFIIAGKSGVTFTLALISTLVVWLTWLWTKRVTKNRKAAYVSAGLLTVSFFFANLVGAVYPDIVLSALTLIALIMIEAGQYVRRSHQIWLGTTLGFLVVVHYKALSLILPLLLITCLLSWRSKRAIPLLTIGVTALFIAFYYLTLYKWFGRWDLSAIEGGQSFAANPIRNATAMLFDSNRSLLVYNPIFILLFVGLPIWFKKYRDSLLLVFVGVVPSIIALCMIPNWNGSDSAVGRYLIEFIPAFVPALGFVLIEFRALLWQRIVVFLLGVATLLVTVDAMAHRWPHINASVYETSSPMLMQIHWATGIPLERILPKFSNDTTLISHYGVPKILICYALLSVCVGYGVYLSKRIPAGKEKLI